MRKFYRLPTAVLGIAILATSVSSAAEKTNRVPRTESEPVRTDTKDMVTRKPSIDFGRVDDLPSLFNNAAELEATDVFFTFDYHFGADFAHSHRVEAAITNLDTLWSGMNRTYEIYSIPQGGYPYGITLVDDGNVPPLAPGETWDFTVWLPSNVSYNRTYVLILSAGDANRNNDIAVDEP